MSDYTWQFLPYHRSLKGQAISQVKSPAAIGAPKSFNFSLSRILEAFKLSQPSHFAIRCTQWCRFLSQDISEISRFFVAPPTRVRPRPPREIQIFTHKFTPLSCRTKLESFGSSCQFPNATWNLHKTFKFGSSFPFQVEVCSLPMLYDV